jgi:hypothetical protein
MSALSFRWKTLALLTRCSEVLRTNAGKIVLNVAA